MNYIDQMLEFSRIRYETIKKYEEVHGKFNDLADASYCFRIASEWLCKQQLENSATTRFERKQINRNKGVAWKI